MTLRVCHLVRQYHPSVGGLENFVADLCHAQTAAGASCEIITLDRVFESKGERLAPEDIHNGIRVRRVPMIGVRRYFTPIFKASMLDEYDVLHVHAIDGFFECVARRPAHPRQIRVATTHGAIFHTKWLAPVKRVYFDAVCRPLAGRYDGILANSQSDKNLFDGAGPHVALAPNGVRPIGAFRVRGGDILTIGRLATHKRVDRLIEALAAPALRDRACTLHIVGPSWDVSAPQIAAIAERLGVAHRIVLHGHVSDAERAAIARQCGVFVSASEYEGFGMTLIEAMSVGLIAVVQPNNSFSELVSAANIGTLANFAHPDIAAAAIARALDETSDADRARAQAFAATFSWESHARCTFELYETARAAKTISAYALSA